MGSSRVTIPVLFQFKQYFKRYQTLMKELTITLSENSTLTLLKKDTFIHLCGFEFAYLFNAGDQLLRKSRTWVPCGAAREPARTALPAALCWVYPAPGEQPTVSCPRPFKQHFIPPDDYKGKHCFALPNKHQEKNVLSEYMMACQLNSSYIINNTSFPCPLYIHMIIMLFFLQHSSCLYAKHDSLYLPAQ